jgi:hypothetical protein
MSEPKKATLGREGHRKCGTSILAEGVEIAWRHRPPRSNRIKIVRHLENFRRKRVPDETTFRSGPAA